MHANIMNHSLSSYFSATNRADCHTTLARLIDNLKGFVYRRRHDARWTMEFISEGARDVTGYDPHRFLGDASVAFAELIAPADWTRLNERVRLAAQYRQRATLEYLIRTAHGTWLRVEDRLTPIVDSVGRVLAIEGIIDRANFSHGTSWTPPPARNEPQLGEYCADPSSN